jgi:hypothetical protein
VVRITGGRRVSSRRAPALSRKRQERRVARLRRLKDGDVADLVFIVLTLAFFALTALLVGAIDRRWSR